MEAVTTTLTLIGLGLALRA